MKFNLKSQDRKLYLKIFFSLILSVVITMLIVSTVLYMNFENIALEQIYSNNINSLTQTSREVSIMTNTAITISNQIFSDLTVAKLLFYEEPEVTDLRVAMDQLTNYRLSNPYIDSIYVYNGKADTFYLNASNDRNVVRQSIQSQEEFDDPLAIKIIKNFKNFKGYEPIPREFALNSLESKYYYTFFKYDAFSEENLDSAIIINISADWISKLINDHEQNKESETFIIDDKGVVVSNRKNQSMMTDISDKSYIKKIIDDPSTGYFIDTVNGEVSLVTYTSPDTIGWTYVQVIPKDLLFNKIQKMKITTILIGIGILVLGLIVTILISKRLYLPIERVMANLTQLEKEKRNNAQIVKQSFIKEIVLGQIVDNKKIIREKLLALNFNMDIDGRFRIILLKIDQYNEFCKEFSSEDRNLFKFAIMNISLEIFMEDYKAFAIDLSEEDMLILLNIPDHQREEITPAFHLLIKKAQEAVMNYLKISISITVSSTEKSIENTMFLYQQVKEASFHRLFYGYGSIIYAQEVMKYKNNEYNYPFHEEKSMIDAIMTQNIQGAKSSYEKIIYSMKNQPYSIINLTMSRLVFAVNDTLNTIKKNNPNFADFEIAISFSLISNVETIEEVDKAFDEFFEEINNTMEDRKNAKHVELIEDINKIICDRYTDPTLSIDDIASELGVSSPYMCKLYKQYTLSTILNTIVQMRMEKARTLLLETSSSVAEVAERIGFTNTSYFYKSFKKYNGTTPNDFRKKAR